MSLKEKDGEIRECQRVIKTLVKRGKRLCIVKTRADELMYNANDLLIEIRKDIYSGISLLKDENKAFNNIKALCKEGELFDANTSPCYDEKLFRQCLESLVETI